MAGWCLRHIHDRVTSGFMPDKKGSGNFGFRLGNVDTKMKPLYSRSPNYSLDNKGMQYRTQKRSIKALQDQNDDYVDPLDEGSLNSDLQSGRYGNELTNFCKLICKKMTSNHAYVN